MSLSELISKLELNESIKFSRQATDVRVVIKKGDHAKNNRTECIIFSLKVIELSNIDVLSHEINRTLEVMRNPRV